MKTFDTLYARNSNGKINEWQISLSDEKTVAVIIIEEGELEGRKTVSKRQILKGKNVGKMNETTPFEQAFKQAHSRWLDKRKRGYKSLKDLASSDDMKSFEEVGLTDKGLENFLDYTLPKNRTDANNLSKPMKAQPYFKDDGTPRIGFPCLGQPKLNGFRVIARLEKIQEGEGMFAQEIEKVVFRSKEGLRYDILEHIESELDPEWFKLWIEGDNFIEIAFDGEMYIHGEILSEISSAVRKRNPKTSKIKFYIFDVACDGLSQKDRITIIKNLREPFRARNITNNIIIDTIEIDHNIQAQFETDNWIKEGYEGAIFRDMKAHYQFGSRPKTMVKLKRSQDKEFIIKDIIGGDNAPDLGIFICIAENGNTFKVNPEGSHEVRREYLTNKDNYISKRLTVRFFERTKDGLPFHAVGVAVRDYE